MTLQSHDAVETDTAQERSSVEVDVKSIPSAALARLIDEVRNEQTDSTHAYDRAAYDRAHNRHNR